MTAGDGHRCHWHVDGHGRCPNPQQFPGVRDVPPFCAHHLAQVEPWIASRAAQRASQAVEWIAWARRQAVAVDGIRRMLGERAGGHQAAQSGK